MAIADPLSRLARQENQLDNLYLPLMLEILLKELQSTVRNALHIRVNAEKDTNYCRNAHSAALEETLQPDQQHCRINIRQIRFLDICSICRQATVKGCRTHPKGCSVRSSTAIIVVKRT
jgi:hypothetical protein